MYGGGNNKTKKSWLNRDPIWERGGFNLYAYVYDDPIVYIDADGRLVGAPAGAVTTAGTASTEVGEGVTITVSGAAGVSVGTVVGLAVAIPAAIGFVSADAYQGYQIYNLGLQNQKANQQLNQKSQDYQNYKNVCADIDPPPGLDPCELAQWQLERKLACRQMRSAFADTYYGGNYDWGHQRYMDILNSEISALEDWIEQNCCNE